MASNSEYEQQGYWHLGQYLPRHPSDIFISAYIVESNIGKGSMKPASENKTSNQIKNK